MSRVSFYSFTVQGSGEFPIDMLRHDSCWPAQPADSALVAASGRLHASGLALPAAGSPALAEERAA